MSCVIGIDISANTFDVTLLSEAGRCLHRVFKQTPQGHQQLITLAREYPVQAIVMEATGVYYLDLAMALHEAGLVVSVINPRSFHHFAQLHLQTNKTDRIDSLLLAEFAQRMRPQPWQPPTRAWLALRDISRRIKQLNDLSVAEKNRLHALKAKAMSAPCVMEQVQQQLAQIADHIQQLIDAAEQLLQRDSALQQSHHWISQAKGIGPKASLALLAELALLPDTLKAKQVVRQAGLDVRLTQSGSSVHRPGRLGKAGNVYLRRALFMPSLSFVRHDPYARAHYQQLQRRGKKKIQALCAIQRKMLTGLWACIQNQQPFDSRLLFNIRPDQT